MRLRIALASALLFPRVFAAQAPRAAENRTTDNCTPPPSALAPTLPAKLLLGMGKVHLNITVGNFEAQQFFDQGLAQMHSFWAREAERSFLQAAALDPAAPMPWWGVAMVAAGDWRPRFQIDLLVQVNGKQTPPSLVRAREAARKAVELSQVPGKATELEKLYIASIAARRDADSPDPDEAFVKGLRALLVKYPVETEARLELALMVMRGFSVTDKKPLAPGSMEAVSILRNLLLTNPNHPGVHHYVIHGFEGAAFAREAWPSCEKYPQLVTNIPHAIHMPGHIYSQTGSWDAAVKSFTAAAVNERSWMQQDKLYGDGHHGHNVHYLATSYSFAGRYEDAVAAATELLGYKENPGQLVSPDLMTSAYAQGWFAMLRTQLQFQKWDAILDENVVVPYKKPRQEAWRHWARALAYLNKGNLKEAANESRQFEQAMTDFQAKTKRPEPAELQVARQELAGHMEAAQGHVDKGLKLLQSASNAERHLTYTEPPYYPRPVAEAWGQVALKHNKASAAGKAFKVALEQYPSDSHAETGLRAAQQVDSKLLAAR